MTGKKRWIYIFFILGIIGVGTWLLWQKGLLPLKTKPQKTAESTLPKETVPEPAAQGLPVKVFRVVKKDYRDIISAMGNIKGQKEIDINFEVQGILKSFDFLEGERLGKGAVVAALDPKDYLQRLKYVKTKLKSAQVELAKEQKEYEMYKKLYDLGGIIKLKLEQAAVKYKQAALEVEGKKREIEFAELELDKTRFYAPFACVLGNKLVDIGERVHPNTKVGVLIDARMAIAEVGVVEREIHKLSIGHQVNLYIDAYPGVTFSGEITSIQPMVAEKSRTVLVKVTVDNSDEYLLSGMFTRVEIIIFDQKNAMMIPRVTIQEAEGKFQVFIVDLRQNKAKIREVELDYTSDEYAEITSGLSPDDLVILNVEEVTDDMLVQVVEEESMEL